VARGRGAAPFRRSSLGPGSWRTAGGHSVMADAPFYYHLNLLACKKPRLGYATALLQPMLERADALGVPCYVESDGATAFYQTLGFTTRVAKRFGGDGGPLVCFMRRDPRPASVSAL